MRCYKCEAGLPHLFHDGGERVVGHLEMTLEPYDGAVWQLPRDRWNKTVSTPVVSDERITDALVRSMEDES